MAIVALLQLVSSLSVKKNLDALRPYFIKASEQMAALIVLPENFALMGHSEKDKLQAAEKYGDGEIQATVSALAKEFGLWVIAGTIFIKSSGPRVRAASLVYDAKGVCVARYDKIHLFDVALPDETAYQESLTIEPGSKIVVVDTPVGVIGLSVCYDVRFPELYRQLQLKGAHIFSIPSAFTAITGQAHWETLLKARAIENLCYVLAPNQGGFHDNGRQTHGHSMIIDPWGNIIGLHQEGAGLVVADIDLSKVSQLRQQFPCNDHHVL